MEHRRRYLEVTYRRGWPLAAYLALPRRAEDRSARVERREAGLVIDFAPDGRAIGIEITSPSLVTLEAVNRALASVGQGPATAGDLAPLSGSAGSARAY